MKRRALSLLLLLCLLFSLSACKGDPNDPGLIYVNKRLYQDTGRILAGEVDETAYGGSISSSLPAGKIPWDNAQSNFGEVGAPYAFVKEGLVILIDHEWRLFTPKDPDKITFEDVLEENRELIERETGEKLEY